MSSRRRELEDEVRRDKPRRLALLVIFSSMRLLFSIFRRVSSTFSRFETALEDEKDAIGNVVGVGAADEGTLAGADAAAMGGAGSTKSLARLPPSSLDALATCFKRSFLAAIRTAASCRSLCSFLRSCVLRFNTGAPPSNTTTGLTRLNRSLHNRKKVPRR